MFFYAHRLEIIHVIKKRDKDCLFFYMYIRKAVSKRLLTIFELEPYRGEVIGVVDILYIELDAIREIIIIGMKFFCYLKRDNVKISPSA